jgi:hypothetical protein
MVFQKLLEEGEARGTLPRSSRKAVKWYHKKARRTRTTPRQIWKEERLKRTSLRKRLLGNMYYFFYDAEGKDSLPYWDAFPIVIPIELTTGGFLGLNFHYLDWRLRAILMDRLYDLTRETDDPSDQSEQSQEGKLDLRKINYERLSAFARYKYFKPCLKHYKFSNMRSRLIQVDMDEWDIALFLPLEKFRKARKTEIWEDSRNIIADKRLKGMK